MKTVKKKYIISGIIAVISAALLTGYAVGRNHYISRFLPGTLTNGTNIGGKTLEEAIETAIHLLPDDIVTNFNKKTLTSLGRG